MTNINQADDDLNNLAKSYLNQKQNVVAAGTGVATSLSSSNRAAGTIANPGPSGFGGADRPGRRIYNPLAKLASYTYNLTLYMITPDAYEAFVASGKQKIDALTKATPVANGNATVDRPGAYIVAQSGGINNTTSKRAPGFELDFYIDNLKFTTLTNTKSAGTETSAVTDITFQITEPYGFSFLSNLRRATEALKQYSDSAGYKDLDSSYKQFYILGIRFYGYDKEGNLVKPNSDLFGEAIDPVGTDALFENFYDFQMTNVKFRLDGKSSIYNIEGKGISGQTVRGTKRGRIPTGVNVSGRTIKDALIGDNGLFSVLNRQQEQLTKGRRPSLTYPNKYNVNFLGDAATVLAPKSLVTPADVSKVRWAGSGAKNTTESNDAAGGQPPNDTTKMFTFNADTSIIQAIENIIKQSEFMVNALKTVYKNTEQPDPKTNTLDTVKNENPTPLCWYTICAEIKNAKWDSKVSDWAYEVDYNIQLYQIPSISSPYIGDNSVYYGPHKRYDYWLTGLNSEVLDFSLQLDHLYYNAVLGLPGDPDGNNQEPTNSQNATQKQNPPVGTRQDKTAGTASQGSQVSVTPGLNPGGDKTGGVGVTMAAQNSVTSYLTDYEAYAKATIKIMGDPDYLVRDATSSINELYNTFYGADGFTINAQGAQVFIELAFKEAKDYIDDTGLLEINEDLFFMPYPEYIKKQTQGAIIFMVTQVDSIFTSGRFEQTLTCVNPTFNDKGQISGPSDQSTPVSSKPPN